MSRTKHFWKHIPCSLSALSRIVLFHSAVEAPPPLHFSSLGIWSIMFPSICLADPVKTEVHFRWWQLREATVPFHRAWNIPILKVYLQSHSQLRKTHTHYETSSIAMAKDASSHQFLGTRRVAILRGFQTGELSQSLFHNCSLKAYHFLSSWSFGVSPWRSAFTNFREWANSNSDQSNLFSYHTHGYHSKTSRLTHLPQD